MSDTGEQEAPKRQKLLACRRCRHRKQKCTEVRPCENCMQSGSECVPSVSVSAPAKPQPLESDYVQRLEARVAQLESLIPQESLDHIDGAQQQDQVMPDSWAEIQPSFNSDHGFPAPNQFHTPPQHSAANQGATAVWEETPPGNGRTDILGTLSGIYSPQLQMDQDEAEREVPDLDLETERFLTQTYFDMAHSQYPFILKQEFLLWAASWRASRDSLPPASRWKGFFVYMVYSIAFLMTKTRINGPTKSQALYTLATSKYLPYVVKSPDPLLRAQGYLLLTMYALHMPSQESIIALSSWTIRFCVMAQLHLTETEPLPTDNNALIHIQHRRRVFWCSYAIDRAVCSSYDFPYSIPDHHITVPFFGNIDDDHLLTATSAVHTASPLTDSSSPTRVSSALHVLESRRLESEIQETLLSRDFIPRSDEAFAWRARIMQKLNAWSGHSDSLSEPSQKGYVSQGWLKMIYYYNVIMLYRPTRATARGMSGDVSVQACCQALLMFRKFQMAREIAQPWLGLLTQFQIGVTLLYCFYATPTSQWKASYKSADVPDAIRACSSTLAILSERWVEAECVRDVFETLAREIPLGQTWERPTVMREAGRVGIRHNWSKMSKIVIHRPTLRMIHEMVTENFVGDDTEGATDAQVHSSISANDTSGTTANPMSGMYLQWADFTNPPLDLYNSFESEPNIEAISDRRTFPYDI